jgi:hypothetical protein
VANLFYSLDDEIHTASEPTFANLIGLLEALLNVVVPENEILFDKFITGGEKNDNDVKNSNAVFGESPLNPPSFIA